MPNWSHNILTVIKDGNKKSESEFKQFQDDNIIYDLDLEEKFLTFKGEEFNVVRF